MRNPRHDHIIIAAIHYLCSVGFLICLSGAIAAELPKENEKATVFFYNVENCVNNYCSLKMGFDQYLAKLGPYDFQPFKDRSAFESRIQDMHDGIVVLSSWHFQQIRRSHSLEPVFVGLLNGHNRQKRILVTLMDSSSNASIGKASFGNGVASATSSQHTQMIFRQMMPIPEAQLDCNHLNILKVPKDIDALMSVGFGMAKAALATETSLNRLQQLNPALCRKIRIVAKGGEVFLTVIAVPTQRTQSVEKLLQIIADMPRHEEGKRQIEMIGLDGWQKLTLPDRMELEQSNGVDSKERFEKNN